MTSLAASALETAKRAGNLAQWASAPFASFALAAAGPGGALMRAALLASLPAGRETLDDLRERIDRLGSRFDGRLRIACVDRRRGHRVVFGSPGAPNATVGQAVSASCAVPSLFTPVWIGGREYVDGGVWSSTNLDIAPAARDTHVLCLNPTAGVQGAHTLVAVARRLARSAVSVEALALRRRGAIVHTVAPDLESAAAMGADFMNPEPRPRVLAAAYRQGLALAATAR
jgi:NTE family protein